MKMCALVCVSCECEWVSECVRALYVDVWKQTAKSERIPRKRRASSEDTSSRPCSPNKSMTRSGYFNPRTPHPTEKKQSEQQLVDMVLGWRQKAEQRRESAKRGATSPTSLSNASIRVRARRHCNTGMHNSFGVNRLPGGYINSRSCELSLSALTCSRYPASFLLWVGNEARSGASFQRVQQTHSSRQDPPTALVGVCVHRWW